MVLFSIHCANLLLAEGQVDHPVAMDHVHGGFCQPGATLGKHISQAHICVTPFDGIQLDIAMDGNN